MINLLNIKKSDHHVNFFSSTLKQNIIEQAASMLLQHVTFQKEFYHITQNTNANAFDEHHHIRRTNKCNSWLSEFPTKSDTSLNRLPIFIESPSYKPKSRNYSPRFHHNQLTLSSNATSNINPQFETSSQPFIMIHKKRLRCDYFLSTMQNCIQPPYSPNHFYAFDQLNMLKLQRSFNRNNILNSKRKYSEVYDDEPEYISSEIDLSQISPSKKYNISSPKTADHISINKYHDEIKSPSISDEKSEIEKQQSNMILSRLEKILNLCGELRSLANDVENHLNEKQSSLPDINEENYLEKSESEPTIIDIYEELEMQQVIDDINEKNSPPPYQTLNDISSIHSESSKSHQLMQTESFKTKSLSLTTSHTTLRKPEDICSCFLKSFFEKQNCNLNTDEQEYLNQLTKAYVLGREQILKQQHEENNKFQAFINENLLDKQNEFDDAPSSSIFDTNNNNQSVTPVSPSSILFYNNLQKSNDHLSSITPIESNDSTNLLNQQQSSIPSGVITIKHQIFINEPIAMKTTNVLPGIGIKYAQQLVECGFSTVRRLLGFYLMIKNDQIFVNWLNDKAQISINSAWLCTNALRSWCQAHL